MRTINFIFMNVVQKTNEKEQERRCEGAWKLLQHLEKMPSTLYELSGELNYDCMHCSVKRVVED